MPLNLKRPIAVIDLETTDLAIETARVVSVGISIIDVDGNLKETEEIFVNPGVQIPKEAIDVHGITNEMVKDKPRFEEVAGQITDKLKDCDLAGYNIDGYDLPILNRELERAGIVKVSKDARVIDVMKIYHKNVRRDLAAAVGFYLGRSHDDAHSAAGDAKATAEILLKQVEKHDLPGNAQELQEYCREKDPSFVDQDGKIIWKDNEAVINFGKMTGTSLKKAKEKNAGYLKWILDKDFSDEVKEIVRRALIGEYPKR